jgi:RecA/RadA recombinase
MGILAGKIKAMVKKEKGLGKESTWMPCYPTGIDIFDYCNGKYEEDGTVSIGISGGRVFMVVGKSGSGKTTFLVQGACNIAEFNDGEVVHMDYERGTPVIRVLNVSGWTKAMYKSLYVHMDTEISTESLFALIKQVATLKKENSKELLYDTGRVDDDGFAIMAYPPTVVILDSLAVMAPDKQEAEEEMSGQMSASAIAKANTQLFKRINGAMNDTNIILMVVNHINAKIDINPMAKTQAQVNFLKQDETLPGGNAPIYLSNCLLKLTTADKLVPEKEFGIKGFLVKGELIKSRSAAAGLTFTMVYDQNNGFDNLLSNYKLMKDSGKIGGAGKSFFVNGLPEVKFSQSTFKQKYQESPELKAHFDAEVQKCLMDLIPIPRGLDSLSRFSGKEVEEESDELQPYRDGVWTDGRGNFYNDDGEPIDLDEDDDTDEDDD